MKIKKLHLKNGYKRFFDLTIDLGDDPKRIVALIGPNGCGKSSVFDGMLFLNNVHGQLGDKGAKGSEFHSMGSMPNYSYHNIEIEFTEGNFYSMRQEKVRLGKENTIFSFRSPYRYNSNLKVNQSRATSEIRLNNYGATTSIDLDDKMEENYRRLNIKFNKYMNENDCKPSEAKLKIMGDLNSSIKSCLDLEIVSIGDIEAGKGTIYFTKKDYTTDFEYNVLSSGEKEVIDILLDLYLRKDEYTNSVFLIDEPELHINTSIQRKMILEINKLINENCQIWIATHSIGFLRAMQDELQDDCQIIEFKQENNWGTESYTLYPIKKSRSKWKDIFNTALDDLTELIGPKRIIYCEGRDQPAANGQEKGFDAKVFNNIFGEKYYDTIFVSSGGNTELDQRSEIAIAILSKVFLDMEILVLKDRDVSSGRFNTEKDRQTYLENNPSSHRMLNRWEIENYLYDKEVLKKYCQINNLLFNEIEYDRFATNMFDQNLKDETGKIRNLCGITTSINPEIFKLNLSKVISDDMNIYKELEESIF